MLLIPKRYVATNKILGTGGMGSVHLYRDINLDRLVAIKHVYNVSSKRDAVDEVRSLESVRSDFVVQAYDIAFGDKPHEIGIVMEYVPGNSLDAYLADRTQRLSDAQAFSLLHQIACGLKDIHKANIIHRDIKPSNIVLQNGQRPIIVDFGLSRAQEGQRETEAFRGTRTYAAPELLPMGGPGARQLSAAADIYSFGCIAWYVLTGTEYCEERHWPNVVQRMTEARPDLATHVSSAIDLCLSLNPQGRPDADAIEKTLRTELLVNRHRALLSASDPYVIDVSTSRVKLSFDDATSILIVYDGRRFIAQSVTGDILVNNMTAFDGFHFDGPCVIYKRGARSFVPFDIAQTMVTYEDLPAQ